MTKQEIEAKLKKAFDTYFDEPPSVVGLVPESAIEGKLYEIYVLSVVIEKLASVEGFSLTFVGGDIAKLKTGGGPINPSYPHFELRREGMHVADMWTDIEFLGISYLVTKPSVPTPGHYHELDIVIVEAGQIGWPSCEKVWLGIECKKTPYKKNLLKEILGVRRELSLLVEERKTNFHFWPRTLVPANPPSCLMVYCTDPGVNNYSAPGKIFGIDFVCESV